MQFDAVNTAYLSSDCEGSFNVSIVQLEYLNEDNIAIVMKYSTYSELNVHTGAMRGNGSGYRTYWLNPVTMRVATTVWDTSVPSSNYATLCPAMQRLPRIGTFGAELTSAVVFLVRYAVNAVLYTPGMAPIWRADGACPAPGASYRHSMLISCGQDLFSLDDMFDSVDDAGAVFWHSLSVIGQLIAGSPSPGADPVLDLLNGMEQYGYGTTDMWSARASVIQLVNVPVKDRIDQALALLTSTPGSSGGMLGGAFRINVAAIAWARFSYKAVSEVALVIAKRTLQGKAQTSQDIWSALWGTLYDLEATYSSVIVDRNLMACGGVRLMFGMTSPWADVFYHGCAMNAEYYASALRLVMDVFVGIPMVKCVCKDAAGTNVRAYVENTCAPALPVSVRPTLYTIVNQLQGLTSQRFSQMACAAVVSDLQTSMKNELNPVFESFELSVEALQNLLDYTLVPWDGEAGHCLDFETDPHMVVIVPQPVDYFAKCADTTLCQSLCGSEWEAFQRANATVTDAATIEVSARETERGGCAGLTRPDGRSSRRRATSSPGATTARWPCPTRRRSRRSTAPACAWTGARGFRPTSASRWRRWTAIRWGSRCTACHRCRAARCTWSPEPASARSRCPGTSWTWSFWTRRAPRSPCCSGSMTRTRCT